MSDVELITTALVLSIYFFCHHETEISFMSSIEMITHMLHISRFNRQLHQIRDMIVDLFFQLSALIKDINIYSEYSIGILIVIRLILVIISVLQIQSSSMVKFFVVKKYTCGGISMATISACSAPLMESLWNIHFFPAANMIQKH